MKQILKEALDVILGILIVAAIVIVMLYFICKNY
jgi:hypothetical protein